MAVAVPPLVGAHDLHYCNHLVTWLVQCGDSWTDVDGHATMDVSETASGIVEAQVMDVLRWCGRVGLEAGLAGRASKKKDLNQPGRKSMRCTRR